MYCYFYKNVLYIYIKNLYGVFKYILVEGNDYNDNC